MQTKAGGGWLCCSSRSLVLASGGLSAVTSLASILLCLYLAISPEAYTLLADTARDWLRQQQGDKEVLDIALSYWDLVTAHHQPVLYGVISAVVVHLLAALLLLLGAMLGKHLLLLPWLVTDLVTILVLFLVFATWSFLSFFVGLLAAILFPFLGGLTLGLKIMLWRQAVSLYSLQVTVLAVNKDYEVLRNTEAAAGGVAGGGAGRKISSIMETNETNA